MKRPPIALLLALLATASYGTTIIASYSLVQNDAGSLVGAVRTTAYPDGDASTPEVGNYQFAFTTGPAAEDGGTATRGQTERINGCGGAASVDIVDNTNNGVGDDCPSEEYSFSSKTQSWSDGNCDTIIGVQITLNNAGNAPCNIVLGFDNATGGITSSGENQTETIAITDTASPVADYYVDVTNGDDSDDGTTTGTAFKTIQKAANVVDPGDTVLIREGTYPATTGDNRVANISRSGTAGNVITFKNYPGETPKIGRYDSQTGHGNTGDQYGIVLLGADYLRFEGLYFQGTVNKCFYGASSGTNGSSHIELINNTFNHCGSAFVTQTLSDCQVDTGHDSINFNPYTNGTLIEGNLIENSGRIINDSLCESLGNSNNHQYRHDHGMYLKGKNHIVINNIILSHQAGSGIKIDGYSQTLGQVPAGKFSHIIINNTFGPNISTQPYDCTSGSSIIPFNSTSNSYNPRWIIANNIFLDPVRSCTTGPKSSVFIEDSGASNFPTSNVCRNNMTTENVATMTCGDLISGVAENVTYTSNVLNKTLSEMDFDDEPNDDYHIGATSDAIGAGNCSITAETGNGDSGVPTTDRDGDARSSTTCDVGAYEN